MGNTLVDRRARRLVAREFGPRRTGLALGAALLLALAGGAAAIEIVSALLGQPARLVPVDRWTASLHDLAWWDVPVRRVAAAVAALGAFLLLRNLLPRRRPRMMRIKGGDPLMAVAVSRSAVRMSLHSAALEVPGVDSARVRLRRGRVSVRAVTHYRNPANLKDLVRTAVTARVAELDLLDVPSVRVRLSWRKD